VKVSEQEFDVWVTRLIRENMPIFNRTVEIVAVAASRENSSLSELAWSILQDPTLTVQVLKLANSSYYNPYSARISTISRAVMRLGSNTIKEICLTISLIEIVLSSLHKQKVALEVARAFHAAVQARRIAMKRNLPEPEEVFVAALLTRIGNIAFWCFAGEVGEKLESALLDCEREDQAELETLGFKLERLTLRLSQEWKLSGLLESALQDKKGIDPRVRSIKLGCAVAKVSEEGWNSPQIEKIIKEAGDFLNLSHEETSEILHESARSAAEITECSGARWSSRLVPLPGPPEGALSSPAHAAPVPDGIPEAAKTGSPVSPTAGAALPPEGKTAKLKPEYPKPDFGIQLYSLRDLSTLVTSGRADVNMVLSIVLEGIYRGIGMDRVLFVLLTPDRRHLKGKYGLGWIDESCIEGLMFSADPDGENILGYLLTSRKPIWVTEKPDVTIKPLLTQELSVLTGNAPFFAMPVAIKGRPIGVIYADRSLSHRNLDEESFESFAFFGQQANMSLSALSGV
jgi:HD-like signal output (HDOD) protein